MDGARRGAVLGVAWLVQAPDVECRGLRQQRFHCLWVAGLTARAHHPPLAPGPLGCSRLGII
jgi:hypothetical protein